MIVFPGDVGFSFNRVSRYSRLVRFFTNGPWSHCFVVIADVFGMDAVIESDLKTQIIPFAQYLEPDSVDSIAVYRPVKASYENIERATQLIFSRFAGETYGFMQLLWFPWRWFCRKLGLKPGNSWFPDGVICSEMNLIYMRALGDEYFESVSHLTDNEVDPQELYLTVITRPDLWVLVGRTEYLE